MALVTESTYPCARGGVAVWCDQLIRNLPEIDFSLIAISATTREPILWQLPPNVVEFRRHAAWDRVGARRHRRQPPLPDALLDLLAVLTDPHDGDGPGSLARQAHQFEVSFDHVIDLALGGDLEQFLTFDAFLGPVEEALASSSHIEGRYERSLADTLAIATALPHLLGPLEVDVGPVDIVHASANGLPALVALAEERRRGTPVVMAEHGLYLRERYLGADVELRRPVVKDVLLRFYRLSTALAYQRCDRLTPASAFNGRWERALGADAAAVSTLHNGVDPAAFRRRTAEVRSPDVVWLGRIDPVKDLHTLIRAADVVRRRIPAVRFRLFGEEPADVTGYLDSCRALTRELDLDNVVRFEGGIGHPVSAFHRGQLSALSSITEGFPYSVLESMSCCVPVVGTEVGGVPEAIADTGLVVPPRNPSAMGAAITRLLTDDLERHRMGEAARARVEKLYALDQMLLHHNDLYGQLTQVVDLRQRTDRSTSDSDDGSDLDPPGRFTADPTGSAPDVALTGVDKQRVAVAARDAGR